jgi:hypothetical protein
MIDCDERPGCPPDGTGCGETIMWPILRGPGPAADRRRAGVPARNCAYRGVCHGAEPPSACIAPPAMGLPGFCWR